MYANVELPTSSGRSLVVPTNALLDSGQEQVVFVAQGDGCFEPRRVRVGQRLDDAVEIISGPKEGESVVAHGCGAFAKRPRRAYVVAATMKTMRMVVCVTCGRRGCGRYS